MKAKIIFQSILIALPLFLSMLFPFPDLFYASLNFIGIEVKYLERFLNYIASNKTIASVILGSILSLVILFILRKINKNKLINSGGAYFNISYFYYYVASKILGYGKVTLVKVPIQTQYKLVVNDTFDEILTDPHAIEKSEDVQVLHLNMDIDSNEINFILNDTYLTKLNEIPLSKSTLPTIIIERTNEFDGVRTINANFITEVRKQTNLYSQQFDQINIFATTNTNHNKAIFEQCFKNGGRTGFKKIVIYDQKSVSTEYGRTFYFDSPHLF